MFANDNAHVNRIECGLCVCVRASQRAHLLYAGDVEHESSRFYD